MYSAPASRLTVASFCLLALLSGSVRGAPPQYAPIMPLASQSLLLDIAAAGQRLVAAGEYGHILFSDDSGANWQQARVPTTRMLTSVFFIDSRRGWAAGHDGLILASDDGGENWRIQRDGLAVQQQTNIERREMAHQRLLQLEQRHEIADETTREQLEPELDDARMALEDADLALEEAVFTSPLMAVWFQDANRGWAAGAFGTLVATEDGGQHWHSAAQELDNPEEFHLNAITGDGRGRVFIAGEGGIMFRSQDSGRSWETLPPFYDGSWFGAVYSGKGDTLFIFGLRGHLYRSTDFGTTWEQVVSDNSITLTGGDVTSQGDIVLVGGVGTVLFSTDQGRTFQRTMIEDRLSLSAGLGVDGKWVVVGQGGVKTTEKASGGN